MRKMREREDAVLVPMKEGDKEVMEGEIARWEEMNVVLTGGRRERTKRNEEALEEERIESKLQ